MLSRSTAASAVSLVLLAGAAIAGSAEATAYEACEPFSVVTTNASHDMTYIDVGEPGPSVGDRRVFRATLQDENGAMIGRTDGHTTVLYAGEDGKSRVLVNLVLQFPTGTILYTITPAITDTDIADATELLFPSTGSDRIITGGSGIFSGAWGNVDVVRGDGASELIFNISCPS